MLKNEGIIIPVYLIQRFFAKNANVIVPQKEDKLSVTTQEPEEISSFSPDMPEEAL